MSKTKVIETAHNGMLRIKHSKNKTVVLSTPEYTANNKKLFSLVDNDNGYHGKLYSWGSSQQDKHIDLEYSEAEYLFYALADRMNVIVTKGE